MNKNLRSLFTFLLLGWGGLTATFAQTAPPANLSGTELRTWLRQNWYDGKRQVLSYSTARGKMYNYIDNDNGKVTCVYSGYQQPFSYSETSTSTSIANINSEHTVPQSWFNEAERMRSDIHHLFPTVNQWNSDRGSDPFAEIPDAQTQKWIIGLNNAQTSIPTSNIDDYSEDTNSEFEPREVHKGNLARAIFYFYTMHDGQTFDPGKGTISAVANLQTLYQWHLQDPVDAREIERNNRVQRSQGNRNPYIDYPELVANAWGFTPTTACSPATQASQVTISGATQTTFTVNWTNGSGNRRLVVVKEGAAANFSPSGAYTTGINADFSQATAQANDNKIVYSGTATNVTVTGLIAARTYHVQVFEYCSTDNAFNTTNVPAAQVTLPDYNCFNAPNQTVTNLTSSEIGSSGFMATFTAGNGDSRLLLVKEGSAPTALPTTGTSYTATANANYASAPMLSDGSRVVYSGTGLQASITGLRSNTTYYVVALEACSNGWRYSTASVPLQVATTVAGGVLPEGVVARQDFENGSEDGWEVLTGFSSSTDNTGTPNGQRIKSGAKSFQHIPTTTGVPTLGQLIFAPINTTDFKDLTVEIFNSSISVTSGNGMDAGDFIEAYVTLNGSEFSNTPDLKITSSELNVRYGMNGTGVVETTAGTPVTKTISTPGDISGDAAPSRMIIRVPAGTTSVQLKLVLSANAPNEVLNIDDVTLYGTSTVTGLPKEIDEQFVVYPNPTTGTFTVQAPAGLRLLEAAVFNAVGQQITAKKPASANQPVTFNLQNAAKGIYILHLRTDKGTLVRRIVVQ
ncbi:endonuclease [Rufibacter sp. LB8]|uniref:endonuclease n=1 Tax=Rufibacter sp. LB8 TaxID=2777781 RepID=UPI00178C7308|nr:endonuclease [Rufibacter sp. LB8]